MPSWVAARPTPSAVAHDRDHPLDLGPQLGAELATGEALLFSTGSPNLTHVRQRRFAALEQLALRARSLALVGRPSIGLLRRSSGLDV